MPNAVPNRPAIIVRRSVTRIASAGVARSARTVTQAHAATARETAGRTAIVNRGARGIPGIPGEGVSALTVEAGENLSALQPIAVIGDLAYAADSGDAAHIGHVVGISSTAASLGADVTVKTDGARIEDASFDFDGGLVYVGPSGTLVESSPTSGFSQSIAVAVASDALIVQIGPPIRRA